MHQILKFILFL